MRKKGQLSPRRPLRDWRRRVPSPEELADTTLQWIEAANRIVLALAGLLLLLITIWIVLEAKWRGDRPALPAPYEFRPLNEPAPTSGVVRVVFGLVGGTVAEAICRPFNRGAGPVVPARADCERRDRRQHKNAATAFLTKSPQTPLGAVVAHEAFVVEPSRAFFRAVEPEAKRNNGSRVATGAQA